MITANWKEVITHWIHKSPKEYAQKLVDVYGNPTWAAGTELCWENVPGIFTKIYVKDEELPHNFPKPHLDYVYSAVNYHLSIDHVDTVAQMTESVLVDRLKNEIQARCHMLLANAITIQAVFDVVRNEMKPGAAKTMYSQRIKGMVVPDWYDDPLNEKK